MAAVQVLHTAVNRLGYATRADTQHQLEDNIHDEVMRLTDQFMSAARIAALFGVARTTVMRIRVADQEETNAVEAAGKSKKNG